MKIQVGKKYVTNDNSIDYVKITHDSGTIFNGFICMHDGSFYLGEWHGNGVFKNNHRYYIVSEYKDDSKPLPNSAFEKINKVENYKRCTHGEYVQKVLFTSTYEVCKYCGKDKVECEKEECYEISRCD